MSKCCVHIISVNIRGLKNKEKRQIVYNWIKNQKADICFLQETYLDEEVQNLVKREWGMDIISSFGTNHSKGVTIVYSKNLQVKIENQSVADDGRRILVNLVIQDTPCTLVNLYAPTNNKERDLFFRKTFFWMKRNVKHYVVIGGDFNCVQDKEKDTQNIKNPNEPCKYF